MNVNSVNKYVYLGVGACVVLLGLLIAKETFGFDPQTFEPQVAGPIIGLLISAIGMVGVLIGATAIGVAVANTENATVAHAETERVA